MTLDVYNTHMELYPYAKDDYPAIEDMYTASDKFTGAEYACGYIIEDGKLFLPRGTSVSKIENMTGCNVNYIKEDDPYDKMVRQFYPMMDPRDHIQEESIEFLKSDEHQLGLNLYMGLGKSYCVANAATSLREKVVVITPNESIKIQWINTFVKMFDYRIKNIMNIAGSNIIDGIMYDEIKIDDVCVFLVNHQTLHSYMSQTNGYQFHKFFKKLEVGIKVYDESHLNFANILLIDFFTNTKRTWYLTATFDRSDKTESVCFKRAFQSVLTYGERQSYEVIEKHVVYHVVNINSRIDQKNRARLLAYPGFTASKYGKYAFFDDPSDTMYKTILHILTLTKNTEGKILIFVPLIDAVDKVVSKLKKDFPEKSVAAYHSKISKEEKDAAEKKDIIVSTIKSAGTGKDISGLRIVINTEALASKVVAEQVIGRLRPYGKDKDTYFFDCVDVCIPNCNYFFRARFRKIETLVKKVLYLDINK